MSAYFFCRGTSGKCVHRDLWRVVWRQQTALSSFNASNRKQPRRTHIKKAKPQPPVDVATLLEQLFSQRRPGTAPLTVGKVHHAKPSTTLSSKISTSLNDPHLSKTKPDSFVLPTASTISEGTLYTIDNAPLSTQPKPAEAPSGTAAATAECQISAETIRTKEGTAAEALPLSVDIMENNAATSSVPVATVESHIFTAADPSVEPIKASIVEGSGEHIIDSKADTAALENTDLQQVSNFCTPTVETTVDASFTPQGTQESTAAESAAECTAEVEIGKGDAANIPYSAQDSTSIETTFKSPDARLPPVEEGQARVSVETLHDPAEVMQVNNNDTGLFYTLHTTPVDSSSDTTIDSVPVATPETSSSPSPYAVETMIEAKADAAPQGIASDLEIVHHAATEEPLLESSSQSTADAISSLYESRADVGEGTLIQNVHGSEIYPLDTKVETEVESPCENEAVEEGTKESEQLTYESAMLHSIKASMESFSMDELLQHKPALDDEVEKQLQTQILVQTELGNKHKVGDEADTSSESESVSSTSFPLQCDSNSLEELEEEIEPVMRELICCVPLMTAKDPELAVITNGESFQVEEKTTEKEALSIELIALTETEADVNFFETKNLEETSCALEEEAQQLMVGEKIGDKVRGNTSEAEALTVDSVTEAIDGIEAETLFIKDAILSSEQGFMKPPDTHTQKRLHWDEMIDQEEETTVMEGMSLESVTLAGVEAQLKTLQNDSLSETWTHLENEAQVLAGEMSVRKKEEVDFEDRTESCNFELSLAEASGLEDLQTDELMEELLFTVPGNVAEVTAAECDGKDPVQRLFVQKIREYDNLNRLSEGPVEAEPDYQRHLSEETAKLQRLYGGGDLSRFPQFTFTDPELDPDNK